MSFRRKLLAVFALTAFLSIPAVAWIVSTTTRRAFERAKEQRTAALLAQFRREFNRRGEEVVHRVETIAQREASTRMALRLSRAGARDHGANRAEEQSVAGH